MEPIADLNTVMTPSWERASHLERGSSPVATSGVAPSSAPVAGTTTGAASSELPALSQGQGDHFQASGAEVEASSPRAPEGAGHPTHLAALRALASNIGAEPAANSEPSGKASAGSKPAQVTAGKTWPDAIDKTTGRAHITDPGRLLAGGDTAEYQKFYMNHQNNYVADCNGTCAYGKPSKREEPGLCEGTALQALLSKRVKMPEWAMPKVQDNGEYTQAPLKGAAALQAAGDKGYNDLTYHKGAPDKVLDGLLDQVQRYGAGILGMNFTDEHGKADTGHALLVTEVRDGKAHYSRPDGGTEERPARLFYFLDPNQKDGVPDDPRKQQAIVQFTDTKEVSWTPDVRAFYAPKEEDPTSPQRQRWLKPGDIDYATVSSTQVQNSLRRLQHGADYFPKQRGEPYSELAPLKP